jgi:hypothetical protein
MPPVHTDPIVTAPSAGKAMGISGLATWHHIRICVPLLRWTSGFHGGGAIHTSARKVTRGDRAV